eukprot:556263-Prymnesium_polylepis.2
MVHGAQREASSEPRRAHAALRRTPPRQGAISSSAASINPPSLAVSTSTAASCPGRPPLKSASPHTW